MILWNVSIKSGHKTSSIISKTRRGSEILLYSLEKDRFRIGKVTSCHKTERRTPYRLRTVNNLIDVYLTMSFLVKKEDGKVVTRRLCDIRDTFLFAIYKDGKIVFEKYQSFLQDPALMRHYAIEFKSPYKGYDYYVANNFIIRRKEK